MLKACGDRSTCFIGIDAPEKAPVAALPPGRVVASIYPCGLVIIYINLMYVCSPKVKKMTHSLSSP